MISIFKYILSRNGFLITVFIGILIYFLLDLNLVYAVEVNEAPKKNFDMIPFFWTVGIVGGCIAITLAYVSWRKYKAEERKQDKKKSIG